jgi:hypothetical protein
MKILKLMADYHCFPLWNVSSCEVGNISPDDLPLSKTLNKRLAYWASVYDKTLNMEYPPDSGFSSEQEEKWFKQEGALIFECLKHEIGHEYHVIAQLDC